LHLPHHHHHQHHQSQLAAHEAASLAPLGKALDSFGSFVLRGRSFVSGLSSATGEWQVAEALLLQPQPQPQPQPQQQQQQQQQQQPSPPQFDQGSLRRMEAGKVSARRRCAWAVVVFVLCARTLIDLISRQQTLWYAVLYHMMYYIIIQVSKGWTHHLNLALPALPAGATPAERRAAEGSVWRLGYKQADGRYLPTLSTLLLCHYCSYLPAGPTAASSSAGTR
jgi:hypothetical protein